MSSKDINAFFDHHKRGEWREKVLSAAFPAEVKKFWDEMEPLRKEMIMYESAVAIAEGADKELLVSMRSGKVGSTDLGVDTMMDVLCESTMGLNQEPSPFMKHAIRVRLLGHAANDFVNKVLDQKETIARFSSIVTVSVMKAMQETTEYVMPLSNQGMDDRPTLLALLPDLSKKERVIIRNMSPQDTELLMKRVFLSLLPRASKEPEKTMVARVFSGKISETQLLREIAKDENVELFKGVTLPEYLKTPTYDKKLQEQDRAVRKETRECSSCGVCKPVKELKACANCHSAWYCSKQHQVADWQCHKGLCRSMKSEWINKSNPLKEFGLDDGERLAINIPSFCFAIPPSLTGYGRDVWVLIPQWDMQDKNQCDDIKDKTKHAQHRVVENLKRFFKLERSGGVTDVETVGNMCTDAFILYLGGYRGVDGSVIRQVTGDERFGKQPKKLYQHFTPVPKGWSIPEEDRTMIPFRELELLEAGIDWVRKNTGEREALE